jgi:uncharacterized radical SAM protein YgiQ
MSIRSVESTAFLPMTRGEMERRGWEELDVVLVTGDAYVDHPSFGAAVIGRVLESAGFRVGILAQPDWERPAAFAALGRPRLFVGITAGNLDSMVSNYTGNRLPRREDDYAPGGAAGHRPNRATLVYAQRVRQALGDVPIVLGGIEASLRRLAHYDYWEDRVRRSILIDAQADLLVYGMGERAVVEIARRLASGEPISALTDIRGAACISSRTPDPAPRTAVVTLPSFEAVRDDKREFNEAFRLWAAEQDPYTARAVAQAHGHVRVVQNPPAEPLSTAELDAVHALPFTRRWHPSYDAAGGVPALEPVRWSITSHRGCFGRCAFCALGAHQGHHISSRSIESIVAEVRLLTADPAFRGTITDVGGPTVNMYGMSCRRGHGEHCRRPDCLTPAPCPRLDLTHQRQLAMLRAVREIPRVKHVFIGTGLRYDLLLADRECDAVLAELCRRHVSGQLKVAPEHASDRVLRLMRKPPIGRFLEFLRRYRRVNAAMGRDQYLACYFISAHPGATMVDAAALAEFIHRHHLPAEQVQDFTPTPMSLSSAMYHTGQDPLTGETVHVPRNARERLRQRALAQYRAPDNRNAVVAALKDAGREDLLSVLAAGRARRKSTPRGTVPFSEKSIEKGDRPRRPAQRRRRGRV